MEKIINAKQAAKDTIESELKAEIARINECISKAKEKGKNKCAYTVNGKPELLSDSSETLLKRAGYSVLLIGTGDEIPEEFAEEGIYNIISWEKAYKKALRNKSNFKEFMGAAGEETSDSKR